MTKFAFGQFISNPFANGLCVIARFSDKISDRAFAYVKFYHIVKETFD